MDASISRLHPCARGSSGLPGTAITSRPASAASRAVMSEPDRGAASTTTVPSASPAMIRLREGKWRASGWLPGGCSATSSASCATCSCRSAFSGGKAMSIPLAITPIVRGSAPTCAAVSIPRARPDTTVTPSAARSCASVRANRQAAADALRAPTIPTHIAVASDRSPRTISAGGAVSSAASRAG